MNWATELKLRPLQIYSLFRVQKTCTVWLLGPQKNGDEHESNLIIIRHTICIVVLIISNVQLIHDFFLGTLQVVGQLWKRAITDQVQSCRPSSKEDQNMDNI